MAYSGGTFSRLYSWVTDRNNAVKIRADRMDAEDDGFASALSTAVLKDGTQTITANLPMSGFKFTGLGAGTLAGHSLRYEQLFVATSLTLLGPLVVTGKITPATDDGGALGDTTHNFSDLFLATGAVINYANGNYTVTHSAGLLTTSGALTLGGALIGTTANFSGALVATSGTFSLAVKPSANDAAALGASGTAWSDLFLASGAVIDFAAANIVVTHSSGILTMGTGEMRITTPGTNSASVVTVGGTQTLTNKTLTGAVLNGTLGATTPAAATVTTLAITEGVIIQGSYTPTITGVTNYQTSTSRTCYYIRVGAVVTVFGSIDIDPTATGAVAFRLSVPIASNFTTVNQCGGSGVNDGLESALVSTVVATDDIRFDFVAVSTGSRTMNFNFGYVIA